jgi:hypothetical protein
MAKGIEDHVGFFAPQSKQILLASFLLSWLKRACDSFFVAIAMMGENGRAGHVVGSVSLYVGAAWK